MNEPKSKGRPPKPEAERLAHIVTLRLTNELHAKLLRLGGVEWLRERIRRAKDPGSTE
ncbi:MAG: hypothetical protein Q8M01_15435 [Rubrivivax sp.]|nr:hypothetical protein [Rubrivivax sp.]